jgi:ABC-type bacteriocin/lantibiotic exporter with double-glycine peptidase domain
LSWRSGRVLDRRARAENAASLGRDGLIAEIIAGRTTVKALDLNRPMRALWEDKHAATIRESLSRGVHTDTYVNLGAVLTVATTVAITTVGALAIIDQMMSLGSLIAANMLSGRIVAAFNQLFMSWKTYVMCRQSMSRLGEAFALAEERRESAIALARPRGDIAFEKVTFGYAEGQKPVIDEVSLKLAAGGLHGIVGRNGSGKTTLLKLLAGLYAPHSGRVLVDEADIAQFTRAELSRFIGYVPQECVLFSGSIRDNIAKSLPEAADEAIVLAAKRAGAHGFIVDLPDGYATQIGEAGGQLSSGQRQRLSIARALVGDPPVLLLDEPTSFLDRFAEQDLKDTLAELARDHTLVVVTHSSLVLPICATITALEVGRVVLTGPGAEVLPRLMRPRPSPQPVARPA